MKQKDIETGTVAHLSRALLDVEDTLISHPSALSLQPSSLIPQPSSLHAAKLK